MQTYHCTITYEKSFKNTIPLEGELLKASSADIRKVCVSACPQKLRTYQVGFANDA